MLSWDYSDEAFESYLADKQLLSAPNLKRVNDGRSQTGAKLVPAILTLGLMEEESVYAALAEFLDVKLKSEILPDHSLAEIHGIEQSFVSHHQLALLKITDDRLFLATPNPDIAEPCLALEHALDLKVEASLVSPSLFQSLSITELDELQFENEDVSQTDLRKLEEIASDSEIVGLVNSIIEEASNRGASDIHIEAQSHGARIRCRIDGQMHDIQSTNLSKLSAIVSRIKILGNLNIAEKRRPQDGRADLNVKGRNIDIRISTLPTQYGESVVLRLLDAKRVALTWDALGFPIEQINAIKNILKQPNGIFLVTGPTGSGKSTTLYTCLSHLDPQTRKIITVEDPVEQSLVGVNQVQVNPEIDLTFATALRSILRQDPDVVMIGEIRDEETAEIAVRAALVGRLVLATVHTNDAVSAITRMRDLGIQDYLIGSTLRGVLAQRLVPIRMAKGSRKANKSSLEKSNHGRVVVGELLSIDSTLSKLISEHTSEQIVTQKAIDNGFKNLESYLRDLVKNRKLDANQLEQFGLNM